VARQDRAYRCLEAVCNRQGEARRLNLDGDGQGDLAGHGGEHRAVMVYQLDSYRYWEACLKRRGFEYGQFGENLTVEGLPDNEVCIGDRYRIGGALFEVTQPRVTCYRVGIRMNKPQMPALLVSHKRPGFYCRVIEEGEIGAGDEIVKGCRRAGACLGTGNRWAALAVRPHAGSTATCSTRFSAQRRLEGVARGTGRGRGETHAERKRGPRPSSAPPPMWRGFRSLRVAAVQRESVDVISFVLESEVHSPLPAPLPGQFLVIKLKLDKDSDPILRSYSISGVPGTGTYRISVKRSAGAGSRYFHDRVRAGDLLQVSAPRGGFTLAPGNNPVVLLSAGIGATPVLSMLHSLADSGANSTREVWWCYGALSGKQHPFAAETRALLSRLPRGHAFVGYSKPEDADRQGQDYDAPGHLTIPLLQRLQVPKDADFYLCGPAAFLRDFSADLQSWGALTPASTPSYSELNRP
jgi:ferredoxin-NADP reductase